MSQNIYQLFNETFVDKDDEYVYINPESFIWNDINYWNIKEYYYSLSLDSLANIIYEYEKFVPIDTTRSDMIINFKNQLNWDLKMQENINTLTEKYNNKIKTINSIKKTYDMKIKNIHEDTPEFKNDNQLNDDTKFYVEI